MGQSPSQQDQDASELAKLGYAQQLLRDMGGFSNFAVSFSIISILTGAVTLYGHGLRYGGPLVMGLGWPVCTLLTLTVAASLAQLASSFPTAGALYHWASILGGRGWGFVTAWLNTMGQFAITAGIDYGLAEFVVFMLGLPTTRAFTLSVYAAILVSHAVLNHVGVRAVSLLNRLSAWYHIAGVALVVVVLSAFAPKQPVAFFFTTFHADSVQPSLLGPWPALYGFLVGLLQAMWTFTGYDASAHVTEETVDPTRNAPWGIFLSVAVSGVVGYAMLFAVTLAITDLPAAAAAENPFIFILRSGLGVGLGNAIIWVVLGAMWFCGLASITSNSRMLFAFARDGGLPASNLVCRVSPRFKSPHVAVWISAAAAFVVALWAAAYSAMVALSTVALYASYALPIALGLKARSAGLWTQRGPWDLGRGSALVNVIALAWVGVVMILFVVPPNALAGYTFAGFVALVAVYWFGYMRSRFKGPPVTLLQEPAVGRVGPASSA